MLAQAGVNMGAHHRAGDKFNPDGYWEDVDFWSLNTKYLVPKGGISQGEWLSRFKVLIVTKAAPGIPWGWKDPRTADVIECVVRILPDAIYVRCIRPFGDTVQSLMRTHEMWTEELAGELVERRIRLLDQHLKGRNVIERRIGW